MLTKDFKGEWAQTGPKTVCNRNRRQLAHDFSFLNRKLSVSGEIGLHSYGPALASEVSST